MPKFGGCRDLGTKDLAGKDETTEPGIKRRQPNVVPGVRLTRRHATHKAQCDNDAHPELTEWFFFRGGVEAKMRREGSSWWPFFFSVAVLFVATQYEIPFKLSISTFHVSVMPSTPAMASHKVRHPSPSNFSVFIG
jgi:hypothetical protein